MTISLDELIIKHWELMPCKLLLTQQANKLIKIMALQQIKPNACH
jgi:hypothetical protein